MKSKTRKTPFIQFYTDDYFAGTIDMDWEEKGFYLEILFRMWDTKGPMPLDDRGLPVSVRGNPRTVRRLLAQVVARGKLSISGGMIYNDRMMRDIANYVGKTRGKTAGLEPNSTLIEPQLDLNSTATTTENPTESTKQPVQLYSISHKPDLEDSKKEQKYKKENQSADRPALIISQNLIQVFGSKKAATLVSEVAASMPADSDPEAASDWLETETTASGSAAIQAAHRMLTEKRRKGERFSSPIAFWFKTAGTMARNARERPAPTNVNPEWMQQVKAMRARVEAAKAAGSAVAHA